MVSISNLKVVGIHTKSTALILFGIKSPIILYILLTVLCIMKIISVFSVFGY